MKKSIPLQRYIRLVMRISLVQLLMIILFSSISQANTALGQEILSREVSLEMKSSSLKKILGQVEKQAAVKFVYSSYSVPLQQKASLSVRRESLERVLERLFAPIDLEYEVIGSRILIRKKLGETFLPETGINLPDRVIKGTVNDEKGGALPGVNILVKGTQRGTTTNADGNFELSVPDENAVLVFSFVGYLSQELIVGARSNIQIRLHVDEKALEEVVVVGYGTQKRSDLTGAVSSVKAEEIRNLPVKSVSEALQGRAAGVQVTRTDGSPGGGSDIVVRGVGSIGGMAPLYIVDGVRMGAGNNFNLQDVESIEVLKDASAAAIYGAQAAGGVVLVTTKRGKDQDKLTINFNSYAGIRKPINLYKLLNTADYITAKQASGVNTSGWGNASGLPDTDWVDEIYSDSREQSYSLSISGASPKFNYYVSTNYQREGGTIIDNWWERIGLRSNTDYKINNRLKFGQTLYAWKTGSNPVQTTTFPFRSAPLVAVRDESNPYGGWAKTGSFFTGPNLVGNEKMYHRSTDNYALEGNVYLDWEIITGLNFRSTVGANIFSAREYSFREAHDFGVVKNTVAFLSRQLTSQRNFTTNFTLTYNKQFGQHALTAMGGYESYKQDLSSLYGEAQGFQIITYNLGLSTNPSSNRTSGGEFPQQRLLSQFGRINYSFANKYLFTANIRRDGSDRFGPANKWGVFPSFSVGWKIIDEQFMKSVPQVTNLKIRASWGKLGSTSNIPQFTYQPSYGGSGGTNIHGLPDGSAAKGYALTAQLVNQDIKWEEVNQTDIGIDASFFKSSLNFTFDWYSRQTKDMIYQVPVPLSAGFAGTSVYTNIGQMRNKGIELAVDYRGRRGDFNYSVGLNASFNKNLVKTLDGTDNNPINTGAAGDYLESTVARTQAGYPLSQFYGYVTDGIFQTDAEVEALNLAAREAAGGSSVFYQAQGTGAGDLKFRDINGDGRITILDKTFIGNPWPRTTYGITLNAEWKGFEISALLQGLQGVDVFNGNRYYTQYFVGDYNTTRDIFETSFFNGGGLTDRPRVGYKDAGGNYVRDPNSNYTRISDYYVENGSFLKLRNLQIGYTIPKEITEKVRISNLRIYLQGQNIITLTGYTGLDPEVLGRNGTTARGIDTIYSYPRTRLVSVGLDLTF